MYICTYISLCICRYMQIHVNRYIYVYIYVYMYKSMHIKKSIFSYQPLTCNIWMQCVSTLNCVIYYIRLSNSHMCSTCILLTMLDLKPKPNTKESGTNWSTPVKLRASPLSRRHLTGWNPALSMKLYRVGPQLCFLLLVVVGFDVRPSSCIFKRHSL